MDSKKYIGMDVHQATISIAVADSTGKLVIESVIETKAATILAFMQGLPGSSWVAFEEGTNAAWLYDLLKPHVAQVIVCDPRKNALLKAGNKNDRDDPIGKRLRVHWHDAGVVEIVGVVADIRHRNPQSKPEPCVFLSNIQLPFGMASVVIRTSTDPHSLIAAVKSEIHQVFNSALAAAN